jgi:hypothetical protein
MIIDLTAAMPRPAMKVYKITGTTATRAEVLLKGRRRRIEGKSFKIQRVAPKKNAATRATCKPEMEL